MATPALIDLSNYSDLLVRSNNARGAAPNGNIYFDTVANEIQFLSAADAPTIIYPLGHPSYTDGLAEANPLTDLLGLKFEAVYAFENQERASSLFADGSTSEDLRQYDRWTEGSFKFAGSYNFVNGNQPSTDADRQRIRGSGWKELFTAADLVGRIYFGMKGLGIIEATSVPYWQSLQYGTVTPFAKLGNIDEAVQVFGDATVDASTTTFDNTASSMYASIRTYGFNFDRIDTAGTLGIAELGEYSAGAALNETDHLTTGNSGESHEVLTAVWDGTIGGGGTSVAPFTGMSLEKLVTPQNETGFAAAGVGNFTWVLNNVNSGTLEECVAYLDALAQADATVTQGEATLNGKQYDVWYEYTATGKIRPIVGEGSVGTGLFIESLPAADQTSVEFVDDALQTLVYPVYTPVSVNIGQGAIDDANAWFHVFEAALYNTATAVTYQDSADGLVKGIANTGQPFISGTNVDWTHDFTTDGTTNVVMVCEGDGGVTQAKTAFTIADTAVTQSCIPSTENNA